MTGSPAPLAATMDGARAAAPDEGAAWGALVESPIDLAALLARVGDAGVGGTALFVGTVRDHHAGRAVTGIDYAAYGAMAERELTAIARETAAAVPGTRVAVVHRVGTLAVGEASVAVAAAHAHRAEAFAACRAAIEAIKVRVPIWKREHYADGTRAWVDPTAAAAPTPPGAERAP